MSVRLINPFPLSVSSSLSACLSRSHTPSLSLLSFWPETLETNESTLLSSYELLNIDPSHVLSRYQLSSHNEGRSRRKTDAAHHVCDDRQQSAFRVPAFIIVNVDDTCLLPSWQTVIELSGLHNHWLCIPMITFKLMNAFWELGVIVCTGRGLYICLSAPKQYMQMQKCVSCPSSCWRQCNLGTLMLL